MRSFHKLVVLAVCLGFGADEARAETKKAKSTDAGKKEAVDKGGKSAKKEAGRSKEGEKLPFPVPVGHDSKGLKLPSFGPDGRLKMLFTIGLAKRIDENNVDLADMQVQTYDEEGTPEIDIELPASRFNLTTRVLSTDQEAKITRNDFELTGHTMEFNTETREGRLGGGVKMIIFDVAQTIDDPSAVTPDVLPKVTLPPNKANKPMKVSRPKNKPAKESKPRE